MCTNCVWNSALYLDGFLCCYSNALFLLFSKNTYTKNGLRKRARNWNAFSYFILWMSPKPMQDAKIDCCFHENFFSILFEYMIFSDVIFFCLLLSYGRSKFSEQSFIPEILCWRKLPCKINVQCFSLYFWGSQHTQYISWFWQFLYVNNLLYFIIHYIVTVQYRVLFWELRTDISYSIYYKKSKQTNPNFQNLKLIPSNQQRKGTCWLSHFIFPFLSLSCLLKDQRNEMRWV